MALIVCKKCGKKVSDTLDKCIHCGAPLTDDAELPPEDETASSNQSEEAKKKKALLSFDSLSEDDKTILEREFVKKDKWAYKHRRNVAEIPLFSATVWVVIAGFYLIFKGISLFKDDILTRKVYNEQFENISTICLIALVIIISAMFIYAIAAKIIYKKSISRYVYMKKFQKFLLEEKNVEYKPPILSNKQQRIFDSIDLDIF